MTTKTTYLLGILAVIGIGTLLYINLCSSCIAPSTDAVIKQIKNPQAKSNSFSIVDGDFKHTIEDNFNFKLSSPSFLMPISDELKAGIVTIKEYLEANPIKVLALTGLYAEGEENNTPYHTLGLARAHSVKNQLMLSGIPSKQITTAGKLMDRLTLEGTTLLGPITYAITEEKTAPESN